MKKKYFDEITKILKQVYPNLASAYRLEFKNVFGAIGGYVNDRIFISCGKFGVALKLPPEILEELFKEKDIKHLKYFSNGHVKKEYVVLPKRILDDRHQLKKLIDESIKCAISLTNKD